jgi:mono/diheme cytochrome c family protein
LIRGETDSSFHFQKMRRALLLAGLTVSLAGCARTQMPRPTAQQAQVSGIALADLDHGRSLYLARCSVCHQPVAPSNIAAAEWPGHVEEMRERAHLSAEEARLVENYLVTMASATAQR